MLPTGYYSVVHVANSGGRSDNCHNKVMESFGDSKPKSVKAALGGVRNVKK